MIVTANVEWIRELKPKAKAIEEAIRYKNVNFNLDLRMLSDAEQTRLVEIATKSRKGGYKILTQAVETLRLMKADPSGIPVKSLRDLEAALIEHFIKNSPKKWVYMTEGTHRMPYYVDEIEYKKKKVTRHGVEPAYTRMKLKAADGTDKSVTWYVKDMKEDGDLTVTQHLTKQDLRTEDEALNKAYEAEMERYMDFSNRIGAQFSATGTGYSISSRWYSSNEVAMEREGMRTKVVIDDGSEMNDSGRSSRRRGGDDLANDDFWVKAGNPRAAGKGKYEEDDDDETEVDVGADVTKEAEVIALPVHPWIIVFDLDQHQFLHVHVNDLEPYQFDSSLASKLVLDPMITGLLRALCTSADEVMEDIIKGKTGGTIVLSTGDPGTGKTLTAEVFSEMLEKPLYTVQCSQLGLDSETLEKQLGIVLARANRWKAILLIDEADVYIRARGEDLNQNAMVGVWLRLLEYYRGIMFMTSNRATIIDDAILNRATAWVRYKRPSNEELSRIWNVLAEQYQVNISHALIGSLVQKWPTITGRTVKNMLKLAHQIVKSSPGRKYDLPVFEMASLFLDMSQGQKANREAA